MTDSVHAWIMIVFLVFLDLIIFYSIPYLSFIFIDTALMHLFFIVIGFFNALAFVYVMS
jgi:hypothetical protein